MRPLPEYPHDRKRAIVEGYKRYERREGSTGSVTGSGANRSAEVRDHMPAKAAAAPEASPSPYKGAINIPCSACSDGDDAMEYHDHEYVKPENRVGDSASRPPQCDWKVTHELECHLPLGHTADHDLMVVGSQGRHHESLPSRLSAREALKADTLLGIFSEGRGEKIPLPIDWDGWQRVADYANRHALAQSAELRKELQWLKANLCQKHQEMNTCSSGPCAMCELARLRRELEAAEQRLHNAQILLRDALDKGFGALPSAPEKSK